MTKNSCMEMSLLIPNNHTEIYYEIITLLKFGNSLNKLQKPNLRSSLKKLEQAVKTSLETIYRF